MVGMSNPFFHLRNEISWMNPCKEREEQRVILSWKSISGFLYHLKEHISSEWVSLENAIAKFHGLL